MLRKGIKGIVPNPASETWDGQPRLLTEVKYVPNVAETTWSETTYKEVHNAWLFPNIYARTFSVSSDDSRVYVGDSADGGVGVNNYQSDGHYDDISLASARKRNL